MLQDPFKSFDLTQPRRVAEVLSSALWLYGQWPLLFVALSAIVVVPYELVVLAVANTSPLGAGDAAGTALIVGLLESALVVPLISALQVHAVVSIAEAQTPNLGNVIARSLRVLPVVAAAEIVVLLGEAVGFVLLFVPGLILALRWAVVAQTAAIEGTDWPTALRRGAQLTRGNYLRIFALLLIVGLVYLVLANIGIAIAGTGHGATQVLAGIVIVVLSRTFGALVTAVLYFDLRAREAGAQVGAARIY